MGEEVQARRLMDTVAKAAVTVANRPQLIVTTP